MTRFAVAFKRPTGYSFKEDARRRKRWAKMQRNIAKAFKGKSKVETARLLSQVSGSEIFDQSFGRFIIHGALACPGECIHCLTNQITIIGVPVEYSHRLLSKAAVGREIGSWKICPHSGRYTQCIAPLLVSHGIIDPIPEEDEEKDLDQKK